VIRRGGRTSRTLVLCALVLPAFAHDGKLDPSEREALDRAVVILRPGVTLERLKNADHALRDFEDGKLRHLLHAREVKELDEREAVLHAVRSIGFVRTHGRHLPDAWAEALLLGSPRATDWHEGVRLLRRRPFDAGLEQVAVALASDPRPDVRLAAGRLAKTLFVFGRRSDGLERVARRLLVDRVPNVAALFAAYDAHAFESRGIVDLMVARLHDDRELELAPGILAGTGKVRDYVLARLRDEFFWWRSSRPFTYRPGPEEIAAWWRTHRKAFVFGPDDRGSGEALDWTGECRIGERAKAEGPAGPFWIEVRSYEEGWFDGKPVYSAFVQLWTRNGEGEWVELEGCGPRNAEEGEAIRGHGSGSGEPERWLELHLAPRSKEELRVRARIWIGVNRR